jgi:uroporphyrin-III C-methyltransferase
VFGRGGEEVERLAREGIPFRVIPGLTSGLAALTAASIPATERGINQAVILATGHGAAVADGLDWGALARTGQPILLYMAAATIADVAAALISGGMPAAMPAAAIASATLPGQRVVISTVSRIAVDMKMAGLGSPAIIAIGEIVAVRAELEALTAAVSEHIA